MELFSRYGDKYILEPIPGGYKFSAPKYTRVIFWDEAETIISAIDPPGGPMIGVGDKLRDGEIKEIRDQETDFIIILEKEVS